VVLHGLVGAAALNGREGVVKAHDSSTGRYEVHLAGSDTGPEKTIKVKESNLKLGTEQIAAVAPPQTSKQRQRPSALKAYPGEYMAGYDWREVMPEGQTIPKGLEVIMSVGDDDLPTLARIPPKWRLEITVEGGSNCEPLRMDVGKNTTLGEIQSALLEMHPHLEATAAAAADGEGCPALHVNEKRWADPAITVARAKMFGAKVSCHSSAAISSASQ